MASDKQVHHIVPFPLLAKTAAALLALTLLTMIAFWNHHHLGSFAAPIAFLIAAIKASLVLMIFMGLKYDTWINRIVFALGFVFLILLYIVSYTDIATRVVEKSTL
jgi:cytochrome c oxidase subunit IV